METQQIGVVGAGTMGRGIALACLMHGFHVTLSDKIAGTLEAAVHFIHEQLNVAQSRGKLTQDQVERSHDALRTDTETTIHRNADIVIESIIEDSSAKKALFAELETIISPSALIATNTSSISINALSASLTNAGRFLGIHFFNPAHIMKLVEIIPSLRTEDVTIEQATVFATRLGKTPIVVDDVPGFLVNRVVRNFYIEAQRIALERVATIEQIDRLMEAVGFRMGPFRLMDLIGVDTNLAVTKSIYQQYFYEPRYQPTRLQQAYVDAGLYGRKSGRGFYSYGNEKE
jgi:3-hydroxybutyryl-CoA dehydrogenase